MLVKFSDIKDKISEGDVLLFKAPPFPSLGWLVAKYTRGSYSHIGLASWDDGELYVLEQVEFVGGRKIPLSKRMKNKIIDVYRISPELVVPVINEDFSVRWNLKHFTYDVANLVTQTAKTLIVKGYGYSNIWGIFKSYAPFLRFLFKKQTDDTIPKAYVCSTLVTYSYRINYTDLCPNLKDDRTSPVDIARSSDLHYLFTLKS